MRRSTTAALFLALYSICAETPDKFTIGWAAESRLDIRYFITGRFGGYGGFVNKPDLDGAYRIPLEQEGKPAKTLKAILYAPGCQFDLVSVDLVSERTRGAVHECRPLPTISVRGKISPVPSHTGPLDVRISYLASWDHGFFGIMDGVVQEFILGTTPLDEAAQFEIPIPDFSKDSITIQKGGRYLEFIVIEHSTSNIVERVPPSAVTLSQPQ